MTRFRDWRRLMPRARGLDGEATPRSDAGDADRPLLDDSDLRQLQGLSLAIGGALTQSLFGEHQGRRQTQGLEFADYRGYVPGDDLRLIDWSAYARLGEMFVKTSKTEEVTTISLLLDCSRSMDWGRPNKLRYAKRLAAMIGALSLTRSDTVRLFALGDGDAMPGEPLYGAGALQSLVTALERLPVFGTTDLARSVAAARRWSDMRGVMVLISDLWPGSKHDDILSALVTEESSAAVLHVVDAAESLPDMDGKATLVDRESGERMVITVTPAMRRRYEERLRQRTDDLASRCARLGVRYGLMQTVQAPLDALVHLLEEDMSRSGTSE